MMKFKSLLLIMPLLIVGCTNNSTTSNDIKVDKTFVRGPQLVEVSHFNVTPEDRVELLSYINEGDELCVQWVSQALKNEDGSISATVSKHCGEYTLSEDNLFKHQTLKPTTKEVKEINEYKNDDGLLIQDLVINGGDDNENAK